MEKRKIDEIEFHNVVRNTALKQDDHLYRYFWSNRKFYSIDGKRKKFVEEWLSERIPGKHILDYCSGNGVMSVWLAKHGAAKSIGIDLSNVSIENAKELSSEEGLEGRCEFLVMDAEQMQFPDSSFDVVYERGVLHHLDLGKAYSEISRVLRPDGECICIESLRHNPVMQWYRRKTPQLRTKWEVEHILGKNEIECARNYFNKVEILGFFYLFSLLAVPFGNKKTFDPVLNVFSAVDDIVLRLPFVKWLAWQVVFTLSQPIK